MKLKPKCIYGGRDPAFTIHGYFVPCCWVDNAQSRKELDYYGFFQDNFFIDNINSPEELKSIFISPEWTDFYNMLLTKPYEAPALCKINCNAHQGTSTVKLNDEGHNVGLDKRRLLELIDVKNITE